MAFPYLTPLSEWAVSVFEDRENNRLSSMYKTPFVVITSGAKIYKTSGKIASEDKYERANEIYNLLENLSDEVIYKGCIIANNIGTSVDDSIGANKEFLQKGGLTNLSYSLGKTPVGIDFDGKVITVDGEVGRKVSMPIIESMDLDTDGANNTLKTARLTVKCFTLKQLEMFEMFFMKPGMNVMVEFGDNTLDVKDKLKSVSGKPNSPINEKEKRNAYQDGKKIDFEPYKTVTDALIKKNNYSQFCENFSNYFRSNTTAVAEYLVEVRKSLGTYDRVAGKVLDYSFSVNDDGTYTATFEVTQGNQISFAVPTKTPTTKSVVNVGQSKDPNFTEYDMIQKLICTDFNLDPTRLDNLMKSRLPEGKSGKEAWKDDFFNFFKVNKEQKDTTASDKAYISLRFILYILMNYIIGDDVNNPFFRLDIPGFKENKTDPDDEDKLIRLILVDNSPYLISSNEDVIFPREQLPTPAAPTAPSNDDATDVVMNIKKGETTKGTINGYNFDTKYTQVWLPSSYYGDSKTDPIDSTTGFQFGNALNIFLDYQKIALYWNKSYTRTEFLEQVLSMVNNSSYGLFHLVFGVPVENGYPTIMNHRALSKKVEEQNQPKNYRFKPTTINSIVKSFSFNFEMSNLVAGMTIFNTRRILSQAAAKPKDPNINYTLPLPPEAYKSIDNSLYANADGYFSINEVEYVNLKKTQDQINSQAESGVSTTQEKKDEATNEPTNWSEVIKSKSVNFVMENDPKKTKTLIYRNRDLIYKLMWTKDYETTKSTVSPLSVSLTISGFSGLNCGEYFNIDGIPEIYNNVGVFQIINIKHNVAPEGWSTTIDADLKIVNKVKS